MRSKVDRKVLKDSLQSVPGYLKDNTQLAKFKFDISNDNISCFISKTKVSKKACRKTSQSSAQSNKPSSKPKIKKPAIPAGGRKNQRKQSSSPDIVRESSNTILSKIQEKGITCAWDEPEAQPEPNDETAENIDNVTIWSAFEQVTEKSFASTNDFQHYHTVDMGNIGWTLPTQTQHYVNPIPPVSFVVQPELIEQDWRTTLMVRNIPNKYTVSELADEIDSEHENTYDFLYLPCDPKNQCNVGYGFINFTETKHLFTFYNKYNKYIWQKYKSEKICALTYARLQGLNQLIEHFENSKVLNQKQKKYRPIIKLDKIQKMVMQQQSR